MWPERRKVKAVFFVGMAIVGVAVACIIWSLYNWEAYSTTCEYIFAPGSYHDCGFAPSLFKIALTPATLIPLIFFLMWLTLDLNQPVLGVNRSGMFINQKFFRRTFLSWAEFSSLLKKSDGSLELYFNNPSELVKRQSAYRRYFLRATYVDRKLPFVIDPELKNQHLILLTERYWKNYHGLEGLNT